MPDRNSDLAQEDTSNGYSYNLGGTSALGNVTPQVVPARHIVVPQTRVPQVQAPQAHAHQERRQTIPQGKIVLDIGLPLDYAPNLPKRISVTISDNMDVTELNYHISKKLGVNGNRWKLIVVSDERRPCILDKNSELKRFQFNKKERLYFYPEIRVR